MSTVSKMKNFKFQLHKIDEWGQAHVFCPVCDFIFKLDGIRKHLSRMVDTKDQKHIDWIKKNKWDKTKPATHSKE